MRQSFTIAIQCLLLLEFVGNAAAGSRPITVWLIPSEEAEARAAADPSAIAREIQAFNKGLQGGRVRVLNTEPPLAQQLIVWNAAFAMPNWAWVKNQRETIRALQRFAALHKVDINIRFETWDRAFSDLNSPRKLEGGIVPPDVVQIGSTWAAYFASQHMIVSRPDYRNHRGSWQSVLNVPACVLPYINDIRLLFYWKRLPTQDPNSPSMTINASGWPSIIDSFRKQGSSEDRLAFAGGLTLNLLMDYSMLVWAGGAEPISSRPWGLHADFTSENALRVPLVLARAASQRGHPVIVVPESSHQELTQAFVVGQYRATIEPANFVSRWKKDFDKTFQATKRFWEYAAAAVPPQTFRGGSFLSVMPSPDLPLEAFEVAEFLTSDDDYTKVLARNSHLPSLRGGFGMDVLFAWLGEANAKEAAEFTRLVQQANVQGKSLPDVPNWPTEIESIDVQEALQRVWRRIGEGNVAGLVTEARNAQNVLNGKIDPATQLGHMLIQFWWICIPAVLIYSLLLWRSHSRLIRVLDQVKRLRGFSSMALLSLDRYHTSLGRYEKVSSSIEEARKRSIIAAGINGWRRGRDPGNWRPALLEDVIWRAVLLAFDVAREADLYEKWEEATKSASQSPREFLEACGRLRKTEQPEDDSPTYFVSVTGMLDSRVDTPFLFEQALACLVQNAIQAADVACARKGPRSPISIVASRDRVTVKGPGGPIPSEIRTLINESTTAEQFETRVLASVRSAGGARPGIGLSESYTIATQCYGGLQVSSDAASVSLLLRTPHRRFPLRNGDNS